MRLHCVPTVLLFAAVALLPLSSEWFAPTTTTFITVIVEAADVILDDQQCSFASKTKTCEPAHACSFQYQFGDLSFDQACRVVATKVAKVPQQLHLAFAGETTGTGMTISWSTFVKVDDPQVWLGTSSDQVLEPVSSDRIDIKTVSYYSDKSYSLYTYHATLSGLTPTSQYFYKVGCQSCAESSNSVSAVSTFTTAREPPSTGKKDAEEEFEVLIYGDFGVDANAQQTLQYLGNLTQRVDFIYHIGDISYADNDFLSLTSVAGFYYEETYNHWMNSLAPVMQTIPYMVLVGNHEAECHSPQCFLSESKREQLSNYTAYNARFQMPSQESGGAKNMWYSFEHGPVHFASISSETDFPDAPQNSFLGKSRNGNFGNQLRWLEADLQAADKNRDSVPWLIVGMHRAMYTLSSCDKGGNPTGEPKALQAAFEALFIKYNVDVVVAGHVHVYERHFPIAKGKKVAEGVSEDGKTYKSPKAPVYLVTGAAGNSEGHDSFRNESRIEWAAAADQAKYGISSLKVTRDSLKFTLIGTGDKVVYDEFVITKS